MRRILFAWELGANYGHLVRLGAIAEQLRAAGHQILFAVRDLRGATEVLGAKGFALAQAPLFHRRRQTSATPASHADMMALEGYADQASTWGRVRGWLSLAQLFRADAIAADYSPGALIAGRILGLPRAQVGTGFGIPPPRTPMPSIRPWEDIPEARLRRSEQRVTEVVNRVARSFRGPELDCLADLFRTEARVFATFPELDPFGPRPGEQYVGPIFETRLGERAEWPDGDRPRIFAYLRRDVSGVRHILRALGTVDAATICFFPGIRPGELDEHASDRLRITSRPLQLETVLPLADLALVYGGHGVVSAAMIAGVPLLVAPQNVEQLLHARRVESAGAGLVLDGGGGTEEATARIGQALGNEGLKSGARQFAARHAGFEPARVVEQAAAMIGSAVHNRPAPFPVPAQ